MMILGVYVILALLVGVIGYVVIPSVVREVHTLSRDAPHHADLLRDNATTIIWIAFIIIWQWVEDYVVQPLVYGRAVNVNPLVTIVSLLAGAELLGILGVLLAIPTAAAIQIILREWWSAKGLHAPSVGTDGRRADEGPTR